MAQTQTQPTTTHLNFPHDPNTELLHLSTKARKYVHLICTTDFKTHLPSPSSPLNSKSKSKSRTNTKQKHKSKRVSFSSSHTTHSWPKNVSILRALYGNPEHKRATDLPPSASKASPTSSILKKDEKEEKETEKEIETDIEVSPEPEIEPEIEHTPPSRRHSFPLVRPKLEVLHKLSELVSRSKQRLSQTFVGRVRSEDGEGNLYNDNDDNKEEITFDFADALTPLPFPTSPHPPLRRYSSPEIDLICPFEDPEDRSTGLSPHTQDHPSPTNLRVNEKKTFSLQKGGSEFVKAVTERVWRFNGGKGEEGGEERGFYGPLWTKRFDLDLPSSIRPDYDEVAFLRRVEREGREGDRALDGDGGETLISFGDDGQEDKGSEGEREEEEEGDEDTKWNQRLATINKEIDEVLVRGFREGGVRGAYRDGWSGRGFRIWKGKDFTGEVGGEKVVVGECEGERGDEREEEEGIRWRIPVY